MEKILNEYLEKIEKYLKPMAVSERIDIVREIKSEMLELQNHGVSTEQIVERLGNPKELAKAYLGESISKNSSFGWRKLSAVIAFYSLAGFSGVFVVPTLLIIVPCFLVMGIIEPILGAVKMIDSLFSMGIPYIQDIQVVGVGGIIELNPVAEFIASIPVGILLFFMGWGAWKLLVLYCRKVSKVHKKITDEESADRPDVFESKSPS